MGGRRLGEDVPRVKEAGQEDSDKVVLMILMMVIQMMVVMESHINQDTVRDITGLPSRPFRHGPLKLVGPGICVRLSTNDTGLTYIMLHNLRSPTYTVDHK